MTAAQFFTAELALRAAVVASSFGQYLLTRGGNDMARADLIGAFGAAFSTSAEHSLQNCAARAIPRAGWC